MIKGFSHQHGYDIFIRNSNGYLIHIWTRNSRKDLQDYKVIEEDICSNPAIVYLQPNLHIFYVNKQAKLIHRQMHALNTTQTKKTTIAGNIDWEEDPICFIIKRKILYLRVVQRGEISYFSTPITPKASIYDQKEKQTDKNIEKMLIAYELSDFWQKIQKQTSFQEIERFSKFNSCFRKICIILLSESTQITNFESNILMSTHSKLQKLQQNNQFYQDLFSNTLLKKQKIGMNDDCLDAIPQQLKKNYLIILTKQGSKLQICYRNNKNLWFQGFIQVQIYPKSNTTLLSNGNSHQILYLDQNDQMVRHPLLINQNGHFFVEKSLSRPYFVWQKIKDRCFLIGQKGYHADCFLYEQENLVIKKFRKPAKALKSNRQVHSLKKVEQAYPNLYHYDIVSKGIITGFSLTFFKGQNWFKLTADPENILKKSPIARVQLIIKMADIMKNLQKIGFCHGDLHLENVIIDIQNDEDLLYPSMDVKVIDFGNGFEMFEGQTVSEGLTGFSPLVPPQVEFSYKKNYNPWGLNAYQLGRNALQILLLNSQKNLCLLDYTPLKQLQLLSQRNQYPQELHSLIKQLVHYQIQRRNKALFQDLSHLQEQTRRTFRSKHPSQ